MADSNAHGMGVTCGAGEQALHQPLPDAAAAIVNAAVAAATPQQPLSGLAASLDSSTFSPLSPPSRADAGALRRRGQGWLDVSSQHRPHGRTWPLTLTRGTVCCTFGG